MPLIEIRNALKMRNCLFSLSGFSIVIYNLFAEMRSWILVMYVISFNIMKKRKKVHV